MRPTGGVTDVVEVTGVLTGLSILLALHAQLLAGPDMVASGSSPVAREDSLYPAEEGRPVRTPAIPLSDVLGNEPETEDLDEKEQIHQAAVPGAVQARQSILLSPGRQVIGKNPVPLLPASVRGPPPSPRG